MKLKRADVQVFLKKTQGKQTPRLDLENDRNLKIELKRLGAAPKSRKEKVIAPG